MFVRTQFSSRILHLAQTVFPKIRHVEIRGVSEPVPLDSFLERSAENLAHGCTGPRDIAFGVVHNAIEKLRQVGKIKSPQDLRQVLDAFSSDLNTIHLFHKAPVVLEEFRLPLREILSKNSAVLDQISVKTLLHHIGIPVALQTDPELQGTWLQHARQVRRILASPDDFRLRGQIPTAFELCRRHRGLSFEF